MIRMPFSKLLAVYINLFSAIASQACGPFFYAAPPTLDHFNFERHATRPWDQIFLDAWPAPLNAPPIAEFADFCKETALAFGKSDSHQIIADIDEWLGRLRESADYRVRFANFLHEARELAGTRLNEADAIEARDYLLWRIEQMSRDDGYLRPRPNEPKYQEVWDLELASRLESVDSRLADCPDFLKPHYLIQRAAWNLRFACFDLAEKDFTAVISSDPTHPRSEVAHLLLGRSQLAHARVIKDADMLQKAEISLMDSLSQFSDGRFTVDAWGWLGAIHSDRQDYAKALACYLSQLDTRTSRDVARSVLRECDRCLIAITKMDSQTFTPFPHEQLAKHPAVAMRFVYHCLDPLAQHQFSYETNQYDGGKSRLDFIHKRLILPKPQLQSHLSALARAVVRNADLYKDKWRPEYLAVLAWAATEKGSHAEAVALCGMATSPDLLLCRAIANQRSGDYKSAVSDFHSLLEKTPDSPLAVDARYRLTQCLQASGESGLALSQMVLKIRDQQENWKPEFLRHESELAQWEDTLRLFSPVDELETALTKTNDDKLIRILKNTLRRRLLATGDFERALNFLTSPGEDSDNDTWPLIPAIDDEAVIRDLAKLKAEGQWLALGDAWMACRGKLIMPLLAGNFTNTEYTKKDSHRRINARELGLKDAQACEVLDRADEAWHAREAYAKAGDRVKENQCLLIMSRLSPYQRNRAFELDYTAQSRALQTPHSAFYVFRPSAESGDWKPGNRLGQFADYELAYAISGIPESEPYERKDTIITTAFARGEFETIDEARAQLQEIHDAFLPGYIWNSQSGMMSFLDDLKAATDTKDLPVAELREYVEHRFIGKPEPNMDTGLLQYLYAYRKMEPAAFLEKYPDSAKAEAALFRITRDVVRTYRTHTRAVRYRPDDAPFWGRYVRISTSRTKEFDAAPVLAALDRYDQMYPSGRYRADVDLLRAGVCIDTREYGHALRLLAAILDNKSKQNLHFDTSLAIADVFQRLDDLSERPTIVIALRETPAAQKYLSRFIHSETFGASLLPIEPWLLEQL